MKNKTPEEFSTWLDQEREKGFKLIQKFVKDYPNTQYPSVDDDLIETFVRGARLLGYDYMILPEDASICPNCKYTDHKIGKNGLSLHVSHGNCTQCNYCTVEGMQNNILKHTPEDCKHPSNKGMTWDESCRQWSKEDCEAVLEAFLYSYKKVLKELFKDG